MGFVLRNGKYLYTTVKKDYVLRVSMNMFCSISRKQISVHALYTDAHVRDLIILSTNMIVT